MSADGECIRLKWPNDIYALVGVTGEDGRVRNEKAKIGGILVSTSPRSGEVDVIIGASDVCIQLTIMLTFLYAGCGLNVLNPHPTTSLSQLTDKELTIEKTMATIIVIFEAMWEKFLDHGGSFEPFVDLYLDRWLHSYGPLVYSEVSVRADRAIIGTNL